MPGGRPSKLTPDVIDRITKAVSAGNYCEVSANYAGINASTFYKWMAQGRKARRGKFREFFQLVERARATAEVRLVSKISQAADDDWKAAAWLLERTKPQRYAKSHRHEISGPGGAPLIAGPEVKEAAHRIIDNKSASDLAIDAFEAAEGIFIPPLLLPDNGNDSDVIDIEAEVKELPEEEAEEVADRHGSNGSEPRTIGPFKED